MSVHVCRVYATWHVRVCIPHWHTCEFPQRVPRVPRVRACVQEACAAHTDASVRACLPGTHLPMACSNSRVRCRCSIISAAVCGGSGASESWFAAIVGPCVRRRMRHCVRHCSTHMRDLRTHVRCMFVCAGRAWVAESWRSPNIALGASGVCSLLDPSSATGGRSCADVVDEKSRTRTSTRRDPLCMHGCVGAWVHLCVHACFRVRARTCGVDAADDGGSCTVMAGGSERGIESLICATRRSSRSACKRACTCMHACVHARRQAGRQTDLLPEQHRVWRAARPHQRRRQQRMWAV